MALPLKPFPVLLATALIFVFSTLVAASPESRQLITQGAADLKAEKYEEGLKKFEAASKSDPKDAEALYFAGAALNRLGRPKEALVQLEKPSAMGYKQPGLAFDTGWVLLRLGRWVDAIVQLEYFEKIVPGRGKASEFIGRAYLGLADYDKAEAKLQEAMRRDPDLKPTALVYLAALEEKRNNPQAARRYVETLVREAPESPIAKILRKEMR